MWIVDCGLCGLRIVDCGLWIVWIMDCGLWIVGCGLWITDVAVGVGVEDEGGWAMKVDGGL